MNMHDPRLGQRIESLGLEDRILSQNPHLRHRSALRNRLITLIIMLVLLAAVVIWMSATASPTPTE